VTRFRGFAVLIGRKSRLSPFQPDVLRRVLFGELGFRLTNHQDREDDHRPQTEAEQHPVYGARSLSQPFAENTEVDVDRDPGDNPDQGRGQILQGLTCYLAFAMKLSAVHQPTGYVGRLQQSTLGWEVVMLARNRKFADSPLEGGGFEPSVPQVADMKSSLGGCQRQDNEHHDRTSGRGNAGSA
jgi:hypothetical protein